MSESWRYKTCPSSSQLIRVHCRSIPCWATQFSWHLAHLLSCTCCGDRAFKRDMAGGGSAGAKPVPDYIQRNQQYYQGVHRLTHLKGRYDRVTSVLIPATLTAAALSMVVSSGKLLLGDRSRQQAFCLFAVEAKNRANVSLSPGSGHLEHGTWQWQERVSCNYLWHSFKEGRETVVYALLHRVSRWFSLTGSVSAFLMLSMEWKLLDLSTRRS